MKVSRRYEYKYLISYIDYVKIKNALKEIYIHDSHGEHDSYIVNSIYLDDIVNSGASDKAFGNEYHKKYRIRHYNDKTKFKLELKEKIGEDSTKYSTQISQEIYQAILNQDLNVLQSHFDDQLIRRYSLDMLKDYITPQYVVEYQREAYVALDGDIRITFDHSLTSSRYSEDLLDEKIKLIKDSSMILEVKFREFLPRTIKEILNFNTLNLISVSKYFMGYETLNI